jgi:hypothetical protein
MNFQKVVLKINDSMLNIFPKNEAKEIIKKYLFWTDFLDQKFASIDELKEKLQTIKKKVIYQGEFGEFYLVLEEAQALGKEVKTVNIEEVLESETHFIFLIERLSRVTVYEKSDLKRIPRGSEVVWLYNADVLMHFVLKDGRYIYPQDYPVNSPYRFGYMVVHNKNGLQGVYDIDSDSLKVPIIYEDIKLFANIAELSKDGKNYEMIDLDTNESIEASSKRSRLNLSKLDMEDYVLLFPIPKNVQNLVKMGLWDAKIGVLEVPSHYRSIIEDTTGVIRWDYPVTPDIFDMSVELPVQFKKRDGEFVTIGIKHEYIILEDRSILNGVVLPPENDDNQQLPVWLKIKRGEFDNVDFSNNSVNEIIALSSDEFNEFVSLLGNDNINMLLIYLKTLDDIELAEFFLYLEDVKLDENIEAPSAKEQFAHMLDTVNAEDLDDEVKARVSLEIPLFVNYAKNIHHQVLDFKEFIRAKYYPYKEGDAIIQFEGHFFKTLYSEPMKFIPDYFNQILTQFRDYFDEKNDEHQKVALHLARRFGLLINSLHVIQKYQDEPYDGLQWFLSTFVETIKEVDGYAILSDDILLFYMMNTFASIIQEDDTSYISSMIEVVRELMKFYPYLSESFLYALQELMKSVAVKEISVDNANRFLEIFEELPKLYDKLSYFKIMELKETINIILANDKPHKNKIFDEEGVKSKLILLNYLVDMEDIRIY